MAGFLEGKLVKMNGDQLAPVSARDLSNVRVFGLYYSAMWCGPCRQVAPVLEEIAGEQAGKLTVAKLNIDENPETARAYQVMSIPTMAVFKGGELVKTIVGARPKAAILRELTEFTA